MSLDDTQHELTPMLLSMCLAGVSLLVAVCVFASQYYRPPSNFEEKEVSLADIVPMHDATNHSNLMNTDDDDETLVQESSLILAWSGISCTYSAKKTGEGDARALHNSFGQLRTGELTAIMGPSGSGKTTLLDILSGRKVTGTVTGSLQVLGRTLTNPNQAGDLLKDMTAYVPQELAFFPMQTPEEAVLFVSRLKHGKTDPSEAHKLLNDVGLCNPDLYTRPIGGTLAGGLTVRGISGGEKKRLALACALAMKPRLILLDEITSGLDSESALTTMQLLKKICVSRGVAAAVIIHQPDGYVFETFSRLILISRGECLFSENVSSLGDLYQSRFACEMPTSTHEVPLDLLRRLKRFTPPVEEDDSSLPSPKKNDKIETILPEPSSTITESLPNDNNNTTPPFYWKLAIVLHRNLMNHYIRNVTNLAARLLCYSACSVLDGAIFWQVGRTPSESVIGAFTFIILISYLLPFATIPIFVHEKKFFLFERSLGLYSPWMYCVSQTLLEAWVVVLAATLEAMIVIPMCGLWNPELAQWESFFTLLSALIASGLTGSSLVLFFSMLMPSQDLAFLVGSGVVTLSLGMSGGFVPFPLMENFVSWLQWVSPCKYSLQALLISYFQGTTNGESIIEMAKFNQPATVSANIGILYVIFAMLAVATMMVLYHKREVR